MSHPLQEYLCRTMTFLFCGTLFLTLAGCGTQADPITIDSDSSDAAVGLNESAPTDDPDDAAEHKTTQANPTSNGDSSKFSLAPENQKNAGDDQDYKEFRTAESKRADTKLAETQLAEIPLPTEEVPDEEFVEVQTIDIPPSWKRLSLEEELWIDTEKKQVITGGYICLTRGGLEMFICPMGTKEHESVIAVNAQSFKIHACFLSLGSNPGSPVQWEPEYKKATGPKVKITVMWKDGKTIVKRDGKELIRDFETKKELQEDWVFGGSIQETDPRDGSSIYYADGGELVCVSNFATAMMDVPIESTNATSNLMFEANTEKLPKKYTKVYVIFEPEITPAPPTDTKPVEKPKPDPAETPENSDSKSSQPPVKDGKP